MAKAHDMERYWRIPADNRDLNYEVYLSEGSRTISEVQDYTSHNTERLNVEQTKRLLLTLPYIQKSLDIWRGRL
jgi:UDP-glucose 4-epimerase